MRQQAWLLAAGGWGWANAGVPTPRRGWHTALGSVSTRPLWVLADCFWLWALGSPSSSNDFSAAPLSYPPHPSSNDPGSTALPSTCVSSSTRRACTRRQRWPRTQATSRATWNTTAHISEPSSNALLHLAFGRRQASLGLA